MRPVRACAAREGAPAAAGVLEFGERALRVPSQQGPGRRFTARLSTQCALWPSTHDLAHLTSGLDQDHHPLMDLFLSGSGEASSFPEIVIVNSAKK